MLAVNSPDPTRHKNQRIVSAHVIDGMTLKTLPRPGSITLRRLGSELRREFAAAHWLDGQLVDRDIAARRHEAAGGKLWASHASEFSVNWKDWASQKARGVYRNLAVTSLPCDAVFNSPKAGTNE